MQTDAFLATIREKGWALLADAVPEALLVRLRGDLDRAYTLCREIQVRNGIGANTDGTVHHLIGQGDSFLDVLEALPIGPALDEYFGGNYIVNTFGGVLNQPGQRSYVANHHRDLRTFSGELALMANVLVMLDDFTVDNGATYLMTGSHRRPDKPTEEQFYAGAERATGRAGSVLVFDSNLWHAAGANHTALPRRALTIVYTRPFMKQQLDYPRALGYERAGQLSDKLRQLVGYNARVPDSLDAWYQPPDKRMYRPGQG